MPVPERKKNMKQHWLSVVNLIITVILLVVVLYQGSQLREFRTQTGDSLNNLRLVVENEADSTLRAVEAKLAAADKQVASYGLTPKGVDAKARALLADVTVELKTWSGETAVTLLAAVAGETVTTPMEPGEGGLYTASVSLPLEEMTEILLDAEITTDGVTGRESLGGWSDSSMLLPIRYSGSGWEGPTYGEDGLLRSALSIHLEGQAGSTLEVRDPEFRVYRNGEQVQTLTAVGNTELPDGGYLDFTTPGGNWSLACDPGDEIEIRFRCRDAYGLGYDFWFANWRVETEAEGPTDHPVQNVASTSSGLLLFWPE